MAVVEADSKASDEEAVGSTAGTVEEVLTFVASPSTGSVLVSSGKDTPYREAQVAASRPCWV